MSLRRKLAVSVSLLVLASPLRAQSGRRSGPGTGNPDEHLVSWKFLPRGDDLVKGPLVLYWLPASLEEVQRSPLRISQTLLEDATRCVGLEIVVPDDAVTIEKLGATGKIPMALIVDEHGSVIRKIENARGILRSASVEQMVADELSVRDEAVYQKLTEAKKSARLGDKGRAIDLYQKIWNDRCLFPLVGSEAQRALKDLGVVVRDIATPPPVDPNLPVTTHTAH
jgi:hypothetical protein